MVLAIGIGSVTGIYGVVNAVLLRPLPYPNAAELIRIVDNVPADESPSGVAMRTSQMTQDAFLWWRDHAKTLSSLAASMEAGMTARIGTDTVRFAGGRVSPSVFAMLGVAPVSGRAFTAADDESRVVMISERVAARVAAGASAIGTTLVLDGTPHTVIGVLPAAFDFPSAHTDVWTPFRVEPDSGNRIITLDVLARIKPGSPMGEVIADVNAVGNAFVGLPPAGAPDAPNPPRFEVVPMQDYLVAPVRNALRLLIASAGLLLLLVCGNVANLLMARGWGRGPELRIRRSLGAGRSRLVRQLLTEGVVLALAGGVAGAAVAVTGIRLVQRLTLVIRPALYGGDRALLPGIERARVDSEGLAFTFAVCLGAGVIFSLMPAFHLSAGEARPRRSRTGLAIAQLAVATMLMIGAGLLIHSFGRLASVDAGYDPSGVLTFELIPATESRDERQLTLATDLAERLSSIAGVRVAGFTGAAPLSSWQEGWGITRHGAGAAAQSGLDPRLLNVQARRVSPGYLRAIGVRLVQGRWLDDVDPRQRPLPMLINRALAKRYFGTRSPIGEQIDMGREPWMVVGVVDDLRNDAMAAEPRPQAYVDFRAMLTLASEAKWMTLGFPAASQMLSFVVRVDGDPLRIVGAVRDQVRQLDASAAVDGAVAMTQVVSSALARERFLAVLPSLFASIAGAVAAFGIYGVLAYGVTRRTREFAIRLALGLAPADVMRMVLGEAGVMTAAGIGLGLAGAAALTRFMRGLLFGVDVLDPATFVLVPLAFAMVAMLAALVPSWRATRIDPSNALRQE
jgi:predicted permease